MSVKSPRQQLEIFERLIEGRKYDRSHPSFKGVLEWLRLYPGEMDPADLIRFRQTVCETWTLTDEELDVALAKQNVEYVTGGKEVKNARYTTEDLRKAERDEEELDALIPSKGFFRDYVEYTRESEAPLAYHLFCAFTAMAAVVNRRCGFLMGPTATIYPPMGIMLIGPSGIKKTSSADIMVGILTDTTVVPIYSEKVTPEALVEAMAKGQANGLVYAPEMAVFLNKQSYNEGLVPLLTRLMDSPDKWITETIGRGTRTLTNVALSCLMCSTSDWFVSNTPAGMFGGGFIARNLIIHQTISPRVIPIPKARDSIVRVRLVNELLEMHRWNDNMFFDEQAERVYDDFYRTNKMEKPEHDMLEAYHQRKAAHAVRLAMVLHLSSCRDLAICRSCFERALAILAWTERFMPSLLRQMFKTGVGEDAEKVLRVIRSAGGVIAHSSLVRKMQYAMNAGQVKQIVGSLKEADLIVETHNKITHTYALKGGE
jgi:hypothetical protein